MYNEGRGIKQNHIEAVKLYKLAAAQGNAMAQYNLGVSYQFGEGVPQSDAESLKWYRLAAENGQGEAQSKLGANYALGQVVAQDYIRAYMWFSLAVVSGYADAVETRDTAAKLLNAQELGDAQKMARECQARKFKGCD